MTKKVCKKGWGCGFSCISRTKNCRSNLDSEGKKLVENFSQFVERLAAGGGGTNPEVEDLPKKEVDKIVPPKEDTPEPEPTQAERLADSLANRPEGGASGAIKNLSELEQALIQEEKDALNKVEVVEEEPVSTKDKPPTDLPASQLAIDAIDEGKVPDLSQLTALGKGQFGTVYDAGDFAIKEITPKEVDGVVMGPPRAEAIDHQNALAEKGLAPKILGNKEIDGKFYQVMEKIPPNFETLADAMWNDVGSVNAEALSGKLKEALGTLEAEKIEHGDLHRENILVDRETGDVRVIDFDFSQKVDQLDPKKSFQVTSAIKQLDRMVEKNKPKPEPEPEPVEEPKGEESGTASFKGEREAANWADPNFGIEQAAQFFRDVTPAVKANKLSAGLDSSDFPAQEIKFAIEDGIYVSDEDIDRFTKRKGLKKAEAKKLKAEAKKLKEAYEEGNNKLVAMEERIQQVMNQHKDDDYKPMMTEEEATNYANKGKFLGGNSTFYHGASSDAINNITTEGVRPEANERGMFGGGFYMGVNEDIARVYAPNNGDGQFLSAKVKMNNPFILKPNTEETMEGRDYANSMLPEFDFEEMGFDEEELVEVLDEVLKGRFGDTSTGPVALALRLQGYDGIYEPNSGYMIPFFKEQVATFDVKDAYETPATVDAEKNDEERRRYSDNNFGKEMEKNSAFYREFREKFKEGDSI